MYDLSQILDDVRAALPQSNAALSYGGDSIDEATLVGVTREMRDGDEGLYAGVDAVVRYRLTREPVTWRVGEPQHIIGQIASVSGAPFRVIGRAEHMGCVRLMLAQVDEER